jgi:hypothetical protein
MNSEYLIEQQIRILSTGEIIKNAYLANVHGQKFICLVLDEKFEPSKTKGRLFKKSAMLSKALGFQELNISLVNIKIDEHRFTNFILAMRSAEKSNRTNLIAEQLH